MASADSASDILDVAAQIIAADGVEALTMKRLVRETGYSRASIYRLVGRHVRASTLSGPPSTSAMNCATYVGCSPLIRANTGANTGSLPTRA